MLLSILSGSHSGSIQVETPAVELDVWVWSTREVLVRSSSGYAYCKWLLKPLMTMPRKSLLMENSSGNRTWQKKNTTTCKAR